MDVTQTLLLGGAVVLAVAVLLRLLHASVGTVLRLGGNTALGFCALYLTQLTAATTGFSLGVNLWNALIVGVLGLPGFALLALSQWTLR